MSVPSGTGCSNTISTNYNGAWASNAACNTDLVVPNLNNYATSNSDSFIYAGVFKAGADGTAQLMWAQNTANATATMLLKDSTINYTRLSGADVAEVYYTHDQDTVEGDIVSLNGE